MSEFEKVISSESDVRRQSVTYLYLGRGKGRNGQRRKFFSRSGGVALNLAGARIPRIRHREIKGANFQQGSQANRRTCRTIMAKPKPSRSCLSDWPTLGGARVYSTGIDGFLRKQKSWETSFSVLIFKLNNLYRNSKIKNRASSTFCARQSV